jgi:hypothetical protein
MTADLQMARRGPALLPLVEAAGESGDRSGFADLEPGSFPRPFVLGYIDSTKLSGQSGDAGVADQVSTARAQLARHADEHQLMLGNIYVDHHNAGGSQLRVLLIAVERFNPQLVLVPSLDHVGSAADVGRGRRTPLEQIGLGTTATVRSVAGDTS